MSDKLTTRQIRMLHTFEKDTPLAYGNLSKNFSNVSAATLRRDLVALSQSGYLKKQGDRKDTTYTLTDYGYIHRPFELGAYYILNDKDRRSQTQFNLNIFTILKKTQLFSNQELAKLEAATATFKNNSKTSSPTIHKRELERFVIEFSWKSSEIEGNTYTLLETERLILEGKKPNSRSNFDTDMILNHKKAYEFLLEQAEDGEIIWTRRLLEHLHTIVVNQLGVKVGLRKAIVGISGSLYRPLSISYQIEEQLDNLIDCINLLKTPYEKALVAVLGLSYLQPFEDGNKRTARMFANGILLGAGYGPLSYRTVDSSQYKEACLVFYEQNSIEPFKQLFIEQYIFSANTYNIAQL